MSKKIALTSIFVTFAAILVAAHLRISSLPLSTATPLLALDALFALALVIVFLIISAAIGLRLLRLCGPIEEVDGLMLLLSLGLGAGVAAYAVLLAGLVGLLFDWTFVAIAAIAAVAARQELSAAYSAAAKLRPGGQWRRFELLVLSIVVVFVALGFLATLGPVVDYDAQSYHLAHAKAYVQLHRITWSSEYMSANFPASIEMLYTLGLLFASDQFAKMLNFSFGLLTSLGLFWLAASRFGRSAGLTAVMIFVSIPLVANAFGRAGVDLGLTFFEFLAIYSLLSWQDSRRLYRLVLVGVFAGLMAGTKYTGLQFAAISMAACFVTLALARTKGFRSWVGPLALPALAGAAVGSVWYLKNWLLFGNPVYPFFFGGPEWSGRRLQILHESAQGYGFGQDLMGYLTLLPNLALHPGRFTLDLPGLVSPFMFLAPVALLVWRRNFAIVIISAISLLQFALWSTGLQETRLLLPLLPWLSLLATAVVLRGLASQRHLVVAAAQVLTIAATVPLLIIQLQQADVGGLRVLSGLESRRDYIASRFIEYPSIEFMNQNLPADAKVLFLWRNRGYYLERGYLGDDSFSRFLTLYEDDASPGAIAARLRDRGYTHVVANLVDTAKWEADPGSVFHEDVQLFDKLRSVYLVSIYRDGQNEVLAVGDR